MALMQDDAVQDRFHETSLSEEDFRTQLLLEKGMKAKRKFVRKWFEFNLNLNNVLAASVCQRHGYDPQEVIVGNNEVAQLLRKGGVAKNANLAAVLPELKDIIAVSEIADLLDRERHIDALRWQWLEEQTRFKYFQIDNVLAYYLQAEILHRWDELTREQGEQIFRALLADLKKDVKDADYIYLATDPDREGDAISWHLYDTLKIKDNYDRVLFYEITKDKVLEGLKNPRKIDYNLVKSQETRRILDRIIGFRLSNLMKKKTNGTSAGRVQSVALKLIVDREREIEAFIPEEYWKIIAIFPGYEAELFKYKEEEIELHNEEEANHVLDSLGEDYTVESIEKKERARYREENRLKEEKRIRDFCKMMNKYKEVDIDFEEKKETEEIIFKSSIFPAKCTEEESSDAIRSLRSRRRICAPQVRRN